LTGAELLRSSFGISTVVVATSMAATTATAMAMAIGVQITFESKRRIDD
jgi:hypothetical protein